VRLLICGLMTAAVLTAGGQPGVRPGIIALYHDFVQEASPAMRSALQEELETIMTPMGFRFEWRDLHEAVAAQASVELAVVTFKGHCDASSLAPAGKYVPGPLGWTHVSDGTILPFSDVDCDSIRQFLQHELMRFPAPQRELILGRAIARVLAHELYHIFADTKQHGAVGIGKESYSVQDLLSTDFRFEPRETKALKTSKAAEALERSIE
jgi:hypothetical protein